MKLLIVIFRLVMEIKAFDEISLAVKVQTTSKSWF